MVGFTDFVVELAPDDGGMPGAFAGMIGGFDALVVEDHPQPVAVWQEFPTGARGLRVTTAQFA